MDGMASKVSELSLANLQNDTFTFRKFNPISENVHGMNHDKNAPWSKKVAYYD